MVQEVYHVTGIYISDKCRYTSNKENDIDVRTTMYAARRMRERLSFLTDREWRTRCRSRVAPRTLSPTT